MRILVVEDQDDLREVVAETLREEAFAVDESADGEEGLYKALNWDYDLVVLDVMMPVMDGWEVLEKLRQEKQTPDGSELGVLSGVLNETFAQLEASFEHQVRFTADASHEMRTPIAVIVAKSQFALSRERSVEKYQEALQTCLDSAQHMRSLTDGLLELAKVDAGEFHLIKEAGNLEDLTREVVKMMEPLADEKAVTFRCDLKPVQMSYDGQKMRQALLNLLANSVKYNREGGEVIITLRESQGGATLRIRDTGVGMDAETCAQIFERFYRADKARTRTGKTGTGLGLAITRAIIEAHGGTISVTSEREAGSEFEVTLPGWTSHGSTSRAHRPGHSDAEEAGGIAGVKKPRLGCGPAHHVGAGFKVHLVVAAAIVWDHHDLRGHRRGRAAPCDGEGREGRIQRAKIRQPNGGRTSDDREIGLVRVIGINADQDPADHDVNKGVVAEVSRSRQITLGEGDSGAGKNRLGTVRRPIPSEQSQHLSGSQSGKKQGKEEGTGSSMNYWIQSNSEKMFLKLSGTNDDLFAEDSDNDGYSDGVEIQFGTDPKVFTLGPANPNGGGTPNYPDYPLTPQLGAADVVYRLNVDTVGTETNNPTPPRRAQYALDDNFEILALNGSNAGGLEWPVSIPVGKVSVDVQLLAAGALAFTRKLNLLETRETHDAGI
eukprot:snap_masked-scaffold3664_size7888-processed-gene-0.0 protein:Tk11914 transcript:snap_masked-scaffold3664_size7888-processed-gene-0.0-mRNA-1 annotation:"hypothetical protein"